MKAETRVVVRRATKRDASSIFEVLKSSKLQNEKWAGNEKWIKPALETFWKTENFAMFVAELDGKIVGFIDYIVFPSLWECSKQGFIIDFFAHRDFQGKGIGKRLLKAVVDEVDANQIEELHVSTGWENEPARRLYGEFGFTEERLLLERERKEQSRLRMLKQ